MANDYSSYSILEKNKILADYIGLRYDYYECDFCETPDPEVFEGSRLTRCCSTTKLPNGEWENPTFVMYTPPEPWASTHSSIGKSTNLWTLKSENLDFNSDWNKLFEVILKIESEGYYVELKKSYTRIYNTKPVDIIRYGDCRLSTTFEALVEFVIQKLSQHQ